MIILPFPIEKRKTAIFHCPNCNCKHFSMQIHAKDPIDLTCQSCDYSYNLKNLMYSAMKYRERHINEID